MKQAMATIMATILSLVVLSCAPSQEGNVVPEDVANPPPVALHPNNMGTIPEQGASQQLSSDESKADRISTDFSDKGHRGSLGRSQVHASYPLLTISERVDEVDYVLHVSVDHVGALRYSTLSGDEPDPAASSGANDTSFIALMPVTMTVQHVYKAPLPEPQRIITADWAPPSSGLFAMDKQMQYMDGQEGILFANRMDDDPELSSLPVVQHLNALSQALTTFGQSSVVLALAYEWMLILDPDVYSHRFDEHLTLSELLDQLE